MQTVNSYRPYIPVGAAHKVDDTQRRYTLSGTIDNRRLFGIGGEAPPSGSYLVLSQPTKFNGRTVMEVKLPSEHAQGASVTVQGKIAERSWGGVETRGGTVFELRA
ncbi:MAG: hypothetical protein H6729_01000 [Deltaproteobacteria bacterium]|nr:hypothetical protein [Deltaproteobacteria bacterium]